MDSMLSSSAVNPGFKLWSGQTKDYKIILILSQPVFALSP